MAKINKLADWRKKGSLSPGKKSSKIIGKSLFKNITKKVGKKSKPLYVKGNIATKVKGSLIKPSKLKRIIPKTIKPEVIIPETIIPKTIKPEVIIPEVNNELKNKLSSPAKKIKKSVGKPFKVKKIKTKIKDKLSVRIAKKDIIIVEKNIEKKIKKDKKVVKIKIKKVKTTKPDITVKIKKQLKPVNSSVTNDSTKSTQDDKKPSKKTKMTKNLLRNFTRPSSGAKKTPTSGKKAEIRADFEKEYSKLKFKLDRSIYEKSELLSSLEQVRLESRNLRSKLVSLGVDVSSLLADENDENSPEESETKENIRLLECQLSSLADELKGQSVARKQLFLHFKGGTGKTCLSVSYAYKLASLGLKVLLIDVDPLGHTTEILGVKHLETRDSLFDVLINGNDITKTVTKTNTPNLFIIPSNISLSAIELPLSSMPMAGERLRMALAKVENDFDFIIMDCAPNIGFLSLNAILSCHDLIVPVLADLLSYHGLKPLFEILASVEKDFAFSFENICIVLNKFNEFHDICFRSRNALEKEYSDFLLKTVIHESTDIANATSLGKSVFEVSKNSRGIEDILKFIFEILFYIGGKKW